MAYDAILGRDFLQKHGALIDLVDGTLSFRKATPPVKQLASAKTAPVMGTFLPQQQKLKEKKTAAKQADPAPSLKNVQSKLAYRSQQNRELKFHRALAVFLLIILYLLTASYTLQTTDDANKPGIQKMSKFLIHGAAPNEVNDDQPIYPSARQVNYKEFDQGDPNEREAEITNHLTSSYAQKTLKSDYYSQLTVDQNLQKEDEKRDDLDAITTHLGNEVPRD